MRDSGRQSTECRRLAFVVPLVGVNVLVFLCFVGLLINGISRFGVIVDGAGPKVAAADIDPNTQAVKDYLARRMPGDDYRIRTFFPATPLEGHLTDVADLGWQPIEEKGVAQRVKIDFYAPGRPKQLDVVYWVQDGKVVKCMDAEHFRTADSRGRK